MAKAEVTFYFSDPQLQVSDQVTGVASYTSYPEIQVSNMLSGYDRPRLLLLLPRTIQVRNIPVWI